MRIVLVVGFCLLLHLSMFQNVNGQTNHIAIGEFGKMVFFNTTKEYPAIKLPWYKKVVGFFTRAPKPVQNITETFPSISVSATHKIE